VKRIVLMLVTATAVASTSAWAQTKIDPQVEEFAKAITKAMNSRNADEAVALLTPDAVLVDPFGKASTGKQAEHDFLSWLSN
jgi:ketosteroid isomerase-like protein